MARSRLLALAAPAIAAFLPACSEPPAVAPPPLAPAPAPAADPTPGEPAPPATIMLGGGCEEAKHAYVGECQTNPASCADTGAPAGTVSYGAVLNKGSFLTPCGAPLSTSVKICAAIRGGRAVGVTVTTTPGDARLSTCIGKAVQTIDFPSSPRLDVTSTVFAAQ